MIELDDLGRVVAFETDGRPVDPATIERYLEAQGPVPSDPAAARIRAQNDEIVRRLLAGVDLTAPGVRTAINRAAEAAPASGRRGGASQATLAALEADEARAELLSRRAYNLQTIPGLSPEDYAEITRLRSFASRASNRASALRTAAEHGITDAQASLGPPLPEEAGVDLRAEIDRFAKKIDADLVRRARRLLRDGIGGGTRAIAAEE